MDSINFPIRGSEQKKKDEDDEDEEYNFPVNSIVEQQEIEKYKK